MMIWKQRRKLADEHTVCRIEHWEIELGDMLVEGQVISKFIDEGCARFGRE